MIQPKPDWFIYSLWFTAGGGWDMMTLYYRDGTGPHIVSRVRTDDPTKPGADPFEFRDHKQWMNSDVKEAVAPEKVRRIVCELHERMGIPYDHVRIDGDAAEFIKKIKDQPWVHTREFTSQEEAEAYVKRKGDS